MPILTLSKNISKASDIKVHKYHRVQIIHHLLSTQEQDLNM